jgi:hypothetical protein
MSVVVKGFGRRPIATLRLAPGPSSESLQGLPPPDPLAEHLVASNPPRSPCGTPTRACLSTTFFTADYQADSKYPPAKPGALGIGPLEAAVRVADAPLYLLAT